MEIIELKGLFVNNFILYDDKETVLIDTGFLNGTRAIKKALNKIGRDFNDVTKILLTHGHFDHVVHIKKLKELTNAPIYCSKEEQIHIDGKFPYKGWNRFTGFLEWMGRLIFRYRSIKLDFHIKDSDVLDIFGGMKVVFLPGHSIGHLGFLHLDSKILFVGDFIDTRRKKHRFPPFFLNSFPERFPESIVKVDEMDLNGIISNHGPRLDAGEQLKRFKIFAREWRVKNNFPFRQF